MPWGQSSEKFSAKGGRGKRRRRGGGKGVGKRQPGCTAGVFGFRKKKAGENKGKGKKKRQEELQGLELHAAPKLKFPKEK